MKQKYISNFRSVFDILERLILFFVLCCTTFLVAQTAPNISYGTPVTFKVGVPITSLLPSNSGGFVPNALQGVTLFADATSGLSRPGEGVFDSFGNFFVANYLSSTILKITPAGVVSVFAGINGVVGNVDSSTGTTAKFSSPLSIAISSDNSLYVCDYGNSSIRKITASGVVSTFAGNNSLLAYPNTIVIDSFGNLFVSTMNHIIKVTQAGVITSIAGGGTNYSTVGTGLDASFYNISGMTIDSINNIYIVDTGYHNIRKMETVSGNYTLVPFAGIGGTQGFTNGPVASATFRYPKAIVIDASGNLFVADGGNYVIRKITSTGIVSTYAFNGTPGSINANLDNSSISDIRGMAIDASKNNIYIIGYFNIIQKLSRFGYSVSPALPSGLSINGEGTIIGTPTTVTAVANYTITATNTFGSNSAIVSISVILATPSITTQAAVLLSSTSVLMTGAITNLGATSPTNRGFVWGTSANPTIDLATKTSLGAQAAIGSFSSTITGLVPNTAYHVRGYATNSIGTDYSTDMVFSTNFNPVITPLFNGLNFIFNFAQQSLVSSGNLSLRLFGTVFIPNSAFQIRLYSNPVTLATGTIDATGTLDQVVTLPADTPVGVHHIALTTLLANNTPFQKEVYITIGADGSVTTDYNVMMMDIPENSTTVATILGSDSDTPAQALTIVLVAE